METNKQSNTEIEMGPIKIRFAEKDKQVFKIIITALITIAILAFFIFLVSYISPLLLAKNTTTLFSGIGIGAISLIKIVKLIKS